MNSELRIWRHMLLAIVLAIISFNQTYVIFQQNITELGCNLYWITLCNLVSYLVVVYLNIYLLIPRYLMRKRYLLYTIVLFVIVFVLMCLLTIIEEGVHVILGQDISYFLNPIFILNYVSSFATIVLCLLGGAITIVLRHWTIDNKRVNQLEWIHIQSEVEQLKAQVNPQLLFNILDRTAVLARSKPDEASGMLLKLSQLLRYQLYDCSRKAVLLKGEINFLTNYLALEQLYSKRIWYSVAAEGEVYRTFVPPLLFIPFVQQAIVYIYRQNTFASIDLQFRVKNSRIHFICSFNNGNLLDQNDFSSIKQRLELLYGDNYSLSISKRVIILKLNMLNYE